jgi:UDPglucose 6-dehydrogenase
MPNLFCAHRRIYGERVDLQLLDSPMDALKGADVLIFVTEWQLFCIQDFEIVKDLLKNSVIFDGCNLNEPKLMREAGFAYFPIGRTG